MTDIKNCAIYLAFCLSFLLSAWIYELTPQAWDVFTDDPFQMWWELLEFCKVCFTILWLWSAMWIERRLG